MSWVGCVLDDVFGPREIMGVRKKERNYRRKKEMIAAKTFCKAF